MDVDAKQKQWLETAAPEADFCYCPGDGTQAGKALDEADVIIGNIAPDLVKKASQLQWLQLNSAGANEYCKPGILPAGVTLTNATGAYGLALSEHMLAQTLAMMKKLYLYYDNQHQALWHDEGPVTSLYGATVVVVGFGNIGRNFGQRVKAMGAHVIGAAVRVPYRRKLTKWGIWPISMNTWRKRISSLRACPIRRKRIISMTLRALRP
mgnify:CR=1 FL=1